MFHRARNPTSLASWIAAALVLVLIVIPLRSIAWTLSKISAILSRVSNAIHSQISDLLD